MTEDYTLKDVVDRLDRLIHLVKLAYSEEYEKINTKLKQDEVYRKIINLTRGGEMSYAKLVSEVLKATPYKQRTIQSRISDLTEMKILERRREGKTVYYSYTNILE